MTIICTVCARGGSVGLPRKNIRMLHGKPLIGWTIEQAVAAPSIEAVFVSTDDGEIAQIAQSFGAIVPYRRPSELAGPAAPKVPVIQDLVREVELSGTVVTKVVDLDPTSPLRSIDDIESAIALLNDETDAVISGYPADKNPYFNMVERKPGGNIDLVMAGSGVTSRQFAPAVYSMNASIYVWHRSTLNAGLWEGRTQLYEMPRERSIDIDSELDFAIVEMLLARRIGQS